MAKLSHRMKEGSETILLSKFDGGHTKAEGVHRCHSTQIPAQDSILDKYRCQYSPAANELNDNPCSAAKVCLETYRLDLDGNRDHQHQLERWEELTLLTGAASQTSLRLNP